MSSSMGLSRASSKTGTSSGAPTPRSNGFEANSDDASAILIPRHRSVPDHLKELCFEALLGSL